MRPRRPAHLPDHAPAFRHLSRVRGGGVLDVRPHVGLAVPGALFDVTEEGWALLDRKEGVATGSYRRLDVTCLTAEGELVPARTYVAAAPRDAWVEPADGYVALVREGLRALGHSDALLGAAAAGEAPPSWPAHVFVYGTLMRGEVKGALLESHAPLSVRAGAARGRLLSLGWYPGMIPPSDPSERVHGQLVRFASVEALLPILDAYEDFRGYGAEGSPYHRVLVEVESDENPALAWSYLYVGSTLGASLLPSGRWTER